MSAAGSNPIRAILYALAANAGIALSKTWAAAVTGSSSLLAEALHSYADTGNQLLLLIGLHRSRRPPDPEHPLGYGKLTYFWSFMVAVLLFSVGGLFSLYEGAHKLRHPEPLANVPLALFILALSIVLEAFSMRGCLREIRAERRDRSLWRWLVESRSSELIVVFGEDLAALLGLSLALGFVTLAVATGEPRYDACGSLAVGALLVVIAVFVAVRVRALLIGRSADPEVVRAIEETIAGEPEILEVYHVITVQVGSGVMLAAKIRLREGLDLAEGCRRINALEVRLKRRFPQLAWSFIEPDIAD